MGGHSLRLSEAHEDGADFVRRARDTFVVERVLAARSRAYPKSDDPGV
jgi:hypothetical protein